MGGRRVSAQSGEQVHAYQAHFDPQPATDKAGQGKDHTAFWVRAEKLPHVHRQDTSLCQQPTRSQVRGEIPHDFTLAIQQLKDSHSVRVPTLPAGLGGDNSYVSLLRYQVSKQSGIQVIDGRQDPTHDWCKNVQRPCLLARLRDRGAMSGPRLVWPLHCCLSALPSTDGCLPQWWIAGFSARGLYRHYSHADDEKGGPPLHAWGRADGALMQWRRAHCTRSLHYHCCPAGDEQRGPPLQAWGRADGALMQWRRAHSTRSLHYHCCPAGDEQRGPPLADGALMQWRCAHRIRSLHYHCCPAGDEQRGPPLQAWGRADGADAVAVGCSTV